MDGMLVRHVRLQRLRWALPLHRPALARVQPRAVHGTPLAAEKRVHFDKIDAQFVELGIDKDLMQEVGGIRVRQHVNPLKKDLQVPAGPLNWAEVYQDPTLPLVLDVGCGYGRFPLALSRVLAGHNLLGLEIRDACVDRANKWSEALGLGGRVRFERANATVSLASMLPSYPGQLDLVTIQFPDPHFKRKHRKRRVVQAPLVQALAQLLRPGGRVLLQSDVEEVAASMRDEFELHGAQWFQPCPTLHNPGAVFHSGHASADGGNSSSSAGAQDVAAEGGAAAATAAESVVAVLYTSSSGSDSEDEQESEGSMSDEESSSSSSSSSSGHAGSLGADTAAAADTATAAEGAGEVDGEAIAARYGFLRRQAPRMWAAAGWLQENPLDVPTEREVYTLEQGLPVYRVMLVRRAT